MSDWVHLFGKQKLVKRGVLTKSLINLLDDKNSVPSKACSSADSVLEWIEVKMQAKIEALEGMDAPKMATANVLLMTVFAPQAVLESQHWQTMEDRVGDSMARTIVIWWSLRRSLQAARGLNAEVDSESMFRLVMCPE